MSQIQENRVFLKDKGLYGNSVRTFLGLRDSAVVTSDDGSVLGYAGDVAKTNLVDAVSQKDGWGNELSLPLDFRVVGIDVMTSLGVPAETQQSMFQKFMTEFTAEERAVYVSEFQSIDPADTAAVQAFVNNMVTVLS